MQAGTASLPTIASYYRPFKRLLNNAGDTFRNTLLDKLKAHHIPGRYQHGKRMWADSTDNAIIYFTFHIRYGIAR